MLNEIRACNVSLLHFVEAPGFSIDSPVLNDVLVVFVMFIVVCWIQRREYIDFKIDCHLSNRQIFWISRQHVRRAGCTITTHVA